MPTLKRDRELISVGWREPSIFRPHLYARLCCAPLVPLRIRSQIGSHRTGGAAGDDNVRSPPARSGYEVYMERTRQTPDRFMKQFGRGGRRVCAVTASTQPAT